MFLLIVSAICARQEVKKMSFMPVKRSNLTDPAVIPNWREEIPNYCLYSITTRYANITIRIIQFYFNIYIKIENKMFLGMHKIYVLFSFLF